MIKLLFVGDVHADEIGPTTRKDNYLQSILNKVDESCKIAKKKQCDITIFLGDIFDKMEPGGQCRNEMLRLLLKHPDIYKTTLVGNHDVRNHIENLSKSALDTLIAAGVFDRNTEYIKKKFGITFFDHYVGIENDIKNGLLKDITTPIIAVHANITNGIRPYDHIIFNDIELNDNCKLVVAGHIHEEMSAVNTKNQIFLNPGSICRNEFKNYHVDRQIQVLYVEIDDNIKYEIIPLRNVLSGSDIFRIEEKEQRIAKDVEINEFIKRIFSCESKTIHENQYEALRQVGKEKNIEPEVIELAVDVLMEASQENGRTK